MSRLLVALGLLLISPLTLAFTLDDLQKQLSQPAVVKGPFIQEKHLRALPQPLLSKGRFVLARDHGLLWLLDTPLRQDYRIDAQGIAIRVGHHCAQPVHRHFGLYASNRASSGVYNSVEDAQALVEAAKGIRKFFGVE